MNEKAVTKALKELEIIAPGRVKLIEFVGQMRSINDVKNKSIVGYHVSLTVFYDDANFTVSIYEWDNTPKNYATLTEMAIEKLKQIANEKAV